MPAPAHMPNPARANAGQNPARDVPLDPQPRNEGHNNNVAPPGPLNNNTNNTYKKKVNITIATVNINGATVPSKNMNLIEKWSMINKTIRTNKIVILALQETHLNEEQASEIHRCFNKSFDLHYSSNPDNPRTTAGVAFIINKALVTAQQISVQALIPGRAIVLTLTRPESKTTIINIYSPVERQKQLEFWNKLVRRKNRTRTPHPDFMVGDFNVTEDRID